jgi:hypothetical protein
MKDIELVHSQPNTKERKATDLCGEESDGARCMRHRGHDGEHVRLFWNGRHSPRWG